MMRTSRRAPCKKQHIRPTRVFTADSASFRKTSAQLRSKRLAFFGGNIVLYRVGHLRPDKVDEVVHELTAILRP